jgi:hypothetical protein
VAAINLNSFNLVYFILTKVHAAVMASDYNTEGTAVVAHIIRLRAVVAVTLF